MYEVKFIVSGRFGEMLSVLYNSIMYFYNNV